MSTQDKTAGNGTAKAATTKPAGAEKSNVVFLPPAKPQEQPPKPKDEQVNTLEDKFLRLDQLQSLREKWEKIKESQSKLNDFSLKTDGRKEFITLQDGNGNKFETFNSTVLRKVVDWLKEDLAAKLKEVETQINF